MIAAYDAQFAQASGTAQPAAQGNPEAAAQGAQDPAADTPSPRLTDKPAGESQPGEQKPAENEPDTNKPKEGEEGDKPSTPNLGELFKDGTFQSGFAAEKIPDNLAAALKGVGLEDEAIASIHESFRAGQAALQRETVGKLHTAAGGKAEFDALVAWGQKNLSAEQREYFDGQLNGPMAVEAIAVLRQRMTTGQDPKLAMGSGSQPVVTGFRSNQEVVAAMADPRYWTDQAYHNDVKAKLAASRF